MSVDAIWYSNRLWARATRVVLTPFSWMFRGIVALRNFGYDLGLLQSISSTVPILSVGNISVGGTGKTPVSAYFVQQLRERGYTPAIVMRGYGNDEPRVHAILTNNVPVYTNSDRVTGITDAIANGANAIVLDDAFQHRRAERDVDVVLVSAERWSQSSVLPSGPLREPRRALRRASLVIVTHKSATMDDVNRVHAQISAIAPHVPLASMHLVPDGLVAAETLESATMIDLSPTYQTGDSAHDTSTSDVSEHAMLDVEGRSGTPSRLGLETLANTRVFAIAGIGDSASFFAQLRSMGATVDARSFPDHHAYSAKDVDRLIEESKGHKYVVTTLKDAVKLTSLWAPKGPHLWYVSQAVRITGGKSLVDATVNNIFTSR